MWKKPRFPLFHGSCIRLLSIPAYYMEILEVAVCLDTTICRFSVSFFWGKFSNKILLPVVDLVPWSFILNRVDWCTRTEIVTSFCIQSQVDLITALIAKGDLSFNITKFFRGACSLQLNLESVNFLNSLWQPVASTCTTFHQIGDLIFISTYAWNLNFVMLKELQLLSCESSFLTYYLNLEVHNQRNKVSVQYCAFPEKFSRRPER